MRWRRGRLPRPRFPSLHKSLEAYGGTIASASDSEEVLGDRALGEFFEPYLYTSLFPASSHIGLRFLLRANGEPVCVMLVVSTTAMLWW